MSPIESEPRTTSSVDQFMEDIAAYHSALAEQTGEKNPGILIDDLFAWTDPQHHTELRAAIWAQTESNWSIEPKLSDTGEAQLVLRREDSKFHYI